MSRMTVLLEKKKREEEFAVIGIFGLAERLMMHVQGRVQKSLICLQDVR